MKNMKLINRLWLLMLALTCTVSFTSCSDDDDDNYIIDPNLGATALVTLKTEGSQFLMQLDDSTRIYPVNIDKNPYGDKELRALTVFRKAKDSEIGHLDAAHANNAVYVTNIDTIRTKPMSADLGKENNEKEYKNDELEIVNDWTTVCEDGYLTLRFRTYFTGNKPHTLRLVKGEGDYDVVLYHDNAGDKRGTVGDGLIAFRLDKLPDTEGKTVDLTLHWKSFSGDKTVKFKYRTRK